MNLAAALTTVRLTGCDAAALAPAMHTFSPLPHRLELLGERVGVSYINDSIATTPVATLAALEAVSGSPVVLIVGGLDRGLVWSHFAGRIAHQPPRAIIGLPDNGPAVLELLQQQGVQPEAGFHVAEDMATAVADARVLAVRGGTILLSPGAPSFPRYRDFRARGRAFARCAGFLEDHKSG
jgi:UDP-N-acetylmuramoylalanine-D-glutamate ligase